MFPSGDDQVDRATARYLARGEGVAAQRALPRPRGPVRAPQRRHQPRSHDRAQRGARSRAPRPGHVPAAAAEPTRTERARPRRREHLPPVHADGSPAARPPGALPRCRAPGGGPRRPGGVRDGPGRRRHLPARLPRGARGRGPARPRGRPLPVLAQRRGPAALPRQGVAGFRADLNLVRDGFDRFGLLDDRVRFLEGPLAATLPDAPVGEVAILRIGRGLGEDDATAALEHLYDRISPGGFVIVDDRPDSGVRRALDAFRVARGLTQPLMPVDSTAVAWRRTSEEPGGAARRAAPSPPPPSARAPGARRCRRPHRGGGPLRHAARSGPHAALALPPLPGGHRRPQLRGDRRGERVRRRSAASGPTWWPATAASSATSTSASRRPRHRCRRSTTASGRVAAMPSP